MKQQLNPRFLTLLCFILAIAMLRIANSAQLTPVANYTPLGAMGLFGGAYFSNRWKALAFPILTIFVSDVVINKVVYQGKYGMMYDGWYWIYGIFAIIVLFGRVILQKINVQNVVLAAVIASVGGFIGLAVSAILLAVMNFILSAVVPGGVTAALNPWVMFGGFASSVTIGLLAGVYPAVRAARLDPIEALRHE